MGAEEEYERLLRADAKRVDEEVRAALQEFKELLPLFEKAKLKSRYRKSKDTRLTFDYHEWVLERDENFIVSFMKVVLRCERLGYLLGDRRYPHFVAIAGSFERRNWGSILLGSRGESEQQVIVDGLGLDDLKLALIHVARSGLVVGR